MKLTRSTWISMFGIVILAALVVLYLMYSSATTNHKLAQKNLDTARLSLSAANKAKSDLAAQLASAVADVAGWNNKISILQTSLGQANLSLTQAQSKFPASVQTIEYDETLMGLAKSCNLTMDVVAATEPSTGSLSTADFTFYTNVFTITVSGQVSDILNFVDKIATNTSFATGAIAPVSFTIPPPLQPPPPLSQAVIDQMRADIKTKMIADEDASITGAARVGLIEQALLTLLGEGSTGPTVDQMTQEINNIIAAQFGSNVADNLSNDIALAIENNLADSLISTVSNIYSTAIAALFTDGDIADLLPVFNGPLGDQITAAIQGATKSALPGIINAIITDKLNSMVSDEIAAMVSDSSVDAALNAAVAADMATRVAAAEAAQPLPSAQITVSVYSYTGG